MKDIIGFIVILWDEPEGTQVKSIFYDDDRLFKLKSEAQLYIKFAERMYPDNKGCYTVQSVGSPEVL